MKVLFLGVSSVLVYACLFLLIGFYTTCLDNVVVTAMSDQDMEVRVYYWNGVSEKGFQQKRSAAALLRRGNRPSTVKISLKNSPIKKIRIDFGERPAEVRIFWIGLHSHFFPPREYGPQEIVRRFHTNAAVRRFVLQEGYALLQADGEDPQIVLGDSIGRAPWMVRYLLPAVLTGVVLLGLWSFQPAALPALRLLQAKSVVLGKNYDSLDGLRGFAALLVVADHTMGRFSGIGLMGVWIFFVLSGFLLVRSFVRQPGRILVPRHMQTYFLRRLKRILPMYFTYIAIFFLFSGKLSSGLRHLLFLEGSGHLWTIPQEMFFYLILPFVLLVNYWLMRGKSRLIVAVLLLASFFCAQFFGRDIVRLFGLGQDLKPYVEAFLVGAAASYWYFGVQEEKVIADHRWNRAISWIGVALLCSIPLWAIRSLPGINSLLAHRYPLLTMMLAGCLILFPLVSGDSLCTRLLSLGWLRAIGIVGFSFYLLHPNVITLVKGMTEYYFDRPLTGFPLFLCTCVITYGLAALTFSYIEYPFMRPAREHR